MRAKFKFIKQNVITFKLLIMQYDMRCVTTVFP